MTFAVLVVLTCLPASAQGDDERVRAGFQNLQKMRPDTAIRHLTGPFIESMRTSDSQSKERSARYLMLIGMGFRADDNVASYLNCARLALQLAPDNPNVMAYNLEALLRASRLDEAKPLADRATKLAQKNASLARSMSMYMRAIGERAEAEQFMDLSMQLDPNDPRTCIHKARFDPSNAIAAEFYARAAKLSAAEPYAQELLLWQSERSAKASKADMAHLLKAKAILPDDPSWKSSLSFALLTKGQQKEAFDLMIEATQTPRLSLKTLSIVSTYCAFNKKPDLAMKAANRAIELAPELPETFFARGHVYNALGDWTNAERDFLKALSLAPHYSVCYQALSLLPQYRNGAKSQELNQKWLNNCPTKVEPWLVAGYSASKQKKWQESYESYSKVCELAAKGRSPNLHSISWCRALAGAGTALYKMGKTVPAGECARKFNLQKPQATEGILRIRPGQVELAKLPSSGPKLESAKHALLADMLYESNELEDCIAEYQRAIELDNNPEWHRGLLKAYIDKQDLGAAMKENLVVSNDIVTKDIPGILDTLRKQVLH